MSTKFTLLSRAAVAALAASAEGEDPEAGPTPGNGGTDQQPADKGAEKTDQQPADSPSAEDPVQVVSASDAASAIRDAQAKATADANARMQTVLASEAGKKNPSLAAFMLANSTASADTIVKQLEEQTGTAPAASADASKQAPIADTTVDIATDPNALAGEKSSAREVEDSWDEQIKAHAEKNSPIVVASSAAAGTTVNTTIPRTGN